jgi:hypothetical protein
MVPPLHSKIQPLTREVSDTQFDIKTVEIEQLPVI